MTDLLVRRLQNFISLNENERRALLQLPTVTRQIKARKDFPSGSIVQNTLHLIDSGFACRYKHLADGRRQILSFIVPGDIGDLRMFILGRTDTPVCALSDLKLLLIDREDLFAITERFPRITRALWWTTLVEESITQEWLVSVGQRSALERMSHLLCEVHARLTAVGKVEGNSFEMPITQNELADTLGLSSVHVNRTLQELRRRGLIVFQDRVMHLNDLPALMELSMFSPSYLHLRAGPGTRPMPTAASLP